MSVRYTDAQRAEILRRIDSGDSVQSVASSVGASESTIYRWLDHRREEERSTWILKLANTSFRSPLRARGFDDGELSLTGSVVHLLFRSLLVGVEIDHEPRDGASVWVTRLKEGEAPPRAVVRRDTTIDSFDLEDLIAIRAPGHRLGTRYAPDVFLPAAGDALFRYGDDVLSGDFAIWPQLEARVKRRAEQNARQRGFPW